MLAIRRRAASDDRAGREGLPLPQANAYALIGRSAAIETKIGNHTVRGSGITAYLKNGGQIKAAAAMANYSSSPTTQLCDRAATR